jgi:hypothetical protein
MATRALPFVIDCYNYARYMYWMQFEMLPLSLALKTSLASGDFSWSG